MKISLNTFTVGIHPRLHLWPTPAPEGIRDARRLREGLRNSDAQGKAIWDRVLQSARQAAQEGPIIAAPETMSADPARTLDRVWRLGLAYHATGDALYADAARRQARAIVQDWCEWIHPESKAQLKLTTDLRTGITVHALGLIYDWFYERLDAGEREAVTAAIRKRGFLPWLKDRIALTHYKSNWCACIAGGMGVAAMATIEDIPESPEIAALAAEHVPRMLEGFGPDGGWEEGASYWDGTALLIDYLDALRTATGGKVDHLSDPRLRRTCWFPIFFTMPPDGLADFADGYYRDAFRPRAFAAVAAANRDPVLQWACRQAMARDCDPCPEKTLLFYDPGVEARPPDSTAGLSRAFRDVGWVAIRNSWDDADDRPVIAAKAGDNRHGGCQHLDVGNLIVSAGGGKLLADYGYGNGRPAWTWRQTPDEEGRCRWNDPLYSTPGHNVVVIAGRNQRLEGAGTISAFRDDGSVAAVTLDCTGAYDGVRSVLRMIVHRRPDLLVVVDAVSLEQPEPAWLSWHLPDVRVTEAQPDESVVAGLLPAVRDGQFRVDSPRYRLTGRCVVVQGRETSCLAGAHRRFGMTDAFGDYKSMPDTLYPYVRTESGSAREHLFLSAFLIRPAAGRPDAVCSRLDNGLALTEGARMLRVTVNRDGSELTIEDSAAEWKYRTNVGTQERVRR